MGKMWLKSVDPAKQCCGCEGKSGPCDSCCANRVLIQDEFVQDENEIYNKFFLRKTTDTVSYTDKTLNWALGGNSTFNSVDRAFLIKAKKNQRFDLTFGEQKTITPTYSFEYNITEETPINFTIDGRTIFNSSLYFGSIKRSRTYSHLIESFAISANKNSIYDYFDFETDDRTSISINTFYPTVFYFTESDKIAARASYFYFDTSIISEQSVYSNYQTIYRPGSSTPQITFSATPFYYSNFTYYGIFSLNPTPPNGTIKEILVYTSYLNGTLLVQDVIIPNDEWTAEGRIPVGLRHIKEAHVDNFGVPFEITKETYLQYLVNPVESTIVGPFQMALTAKKDSCLQAFFNDTNRNINPISVISDKSISFSELKEYVP